MGPEPAGIRWQQKEHDAHERQWRLSEAQEHSPTGPQLQAQGPARGVKKNKILKKIRGCTSRWTPHILAEALGSSTCSLCSRVIAYSTLGRGRGTQTPARQAEPEARVEPFTPHQASQNQHEQPQSPQGQLSPPVRLMDAAGLLLLSYSTSGTLAYIFKVFTSKLALSHTVAPSSSIIHRGAGSPTP